MHSTIGELAAGERAARQASEHHATPHAANRRHSFRVRAEGRATIWHKHELLGSYPLRDLCIEGCSLLGQPSCAIGTHVEVALHLRDRSAPLWLSAEVRRGDADSVGLRFLHTPPRVEDRLQDLVVDAYARDHEHGEGLCLVIEPNSITRTALVRSLDAIGERTVGIATPLDAVQLLLERGGRVRTAFIGPQPTHEPSFELAEFLARHYPHVRRVLIGDAREVAESWVASATGEAHALLELPCSEDALRGLVHRIGMLTREDLS